MKMPVIPQPLRSERFVITLKCADDRRKVFQIGFESDGSLFISFPYFKHSEGLIGEVTFPKHKKKLATLNYDQQDAKVTVNKVKYSHHWSGMALFSQTGKIRSEVRKQSIRLNLLAGHMFTVTIQGLGAFENADVVRDSGEVKTKRTALTFDSKGNCPEAFKIVGRWYSLLDLGRSYSKGTTRVGPQTITSTPEGKKYIAFLLSTPSPNPAAQFALMLTCENIPRVNSEQPDDLIFVGGFSGTESIKHDLKFLLMTYPIGNFDELKRRLGTVDLEANDN
jgi:hypothetical protein